MRDNDSLNKEDTLVGRTERESNSLNEKLCPPLESPNKSSLPQIIFLGVLFLFCRSTFVSYSNMISQLSQQEGYTYLGTISVVCVWLGFGFNNVLIAQNVIQKISYKKGLIICSMNFPIVIISGLYGSGCEGSDNSACIPAMVYFVVIVCSLLTGTLGSVLWISQAGYLATCSPPEKLAFNIGIFFAFNQSCQILANLLSLFLLGNVSHFDYFLILFCIAVLFSFLFVFIPSVEKPKIKELTFRENWADTWELVKRPRVQTLCVYFTSVGICIGFYSGYLYLLIQESLEKGLSRSEINVKTSYVFIVLGVCSFIAGLLCGKLAGKVSVGHLMMFSIILLECSIISSLFLLYSKNYALCFISGGLWGFADSFLTTLTNILVKIEFGKGLQGYVILRFCMCIGVLITCVLSMALQNHSNAAFLLIIFVLQMIAMAAVMELKTTIK